MTQPTLPGIPPALQGRKIETTYHIDLLGKIWMPNTSAAMDYTINDRQIKRDRGDIFGGDLWFEDGESDLDAIDRWLSTNTGDFSQITATRVTKTERASYVQPVKDDDWTVSVHYNRETILRNFTEDEEMEYNDCMYGGTDDE